MGRPGVEPATIASQAGPVRQLAHQLGVLAEQRIHTRRRCAADAGMRPDQPGIWRVSHQQVNGCVVHVGQNSQFVLGRKLHQFFSHRAVGIGAVVQVKLAYAFELDPV